MIADFELRIADLGKAQGYLGHMAAPSLGHYAALSFVVRGSFQIVSGACSYKIL